MKWIQSYANLGEHPKTHVLSELLEIEIPQTLGHLHLLWHFALKFSPNGKLGRFSSLAIARACQWKGDPDVFISALTRANWLDAQKSIHEWLQYAGGGLKQYQRVRNYRLRRKNETLQKRYSNVTDMKCNVSKPKCNVTNRDEIRLDKIRLDKMRLEKTSKEGDGVAKAPPLRGFPQGNELKPSFPSLGPSSAPMPKDSPPGGASTVPIAPPEPTLVAVKALADVSKNPPASAVPPLKPPVPEGWPEFVGWLKEKWRDFQGVPLMFEGKQAKIILAAYKVYGFEVCKASWYLFLQSEDEYDAKAGYSVERWRYRLPGLLEELRKEGKLNGTSGPKSNNCATAAANQTNSGVSDLVGKGK